MPAAHTPPPAATAHCPVHLHRPLPGIPLTVCAVLLSLAVCLPLPCHALIHAPSDMCSVQHCFHARKLTSTSSWSFGLCDDVARVNRVELGRVIVCSSRKHCIFEQTKTRPTITSLPTALSSASPLPLPLPASRQMQHAHAHTAFLCSGEVWPATGGSWIGHVLPGVFLVAWGLHWFISATHSSLTGGPARGRSRGASHLRAPFLPPRLQVWCGVVWCGVEALGPLMQPIAALLGTITAANLHCGSARTERAGNCPLLVAAGC